MNESVLADIFGINDGYEVVRAEYEGHCLRLHVDGRDAQWVCPQCGSQEVSRKGRRHRERQTVPIGLMPVSLVSEVPKCQCRKCRHRFEVAPLLPPPIAGLPIAWWRSCQRWPA